MTTKRASEILIYEGDNARVEVRRDGESVWLTQEQVGLLFGGERSVITKHIRNVFAEGELDEKSNVQNLHIAGSDKPVKFYNLDVIIAVGYRVKSIQGTRFRQWATRWGDNGDISLWIMGTSPFLLNRQCDYGEFAVIKSHAE